MKFSITIISLVKNNYQSLKKTGLSIFNQDINFPVEWFVIDGSNKICFKKNYKNIKLLEKNNKFIKSRHKNLNILNIKGIYPSMNYGLKNANGSSIIFLNSGDVFFDKKSLRTLYEKLINLNNKKSFVFGQANILYNKNLFWLFPGKRVKNINFWLTYFDPNHQSMLVNRKLALEFLFEENCKVIADGLWKRKIINNAETYSYINKPVVTFFLDGISNMRPKFAIMMNQVTNKKISIMRKLIVLIKFIIPPNFYIFYPYFQKYKSLLIDIIF